MNNVRTSKKRDAMLALLQSTHCHPSADWVYREMKVRYLDLSLGTVYRNLNHLCGLCRSAYLPLPLYLQPLRRHRGPA